MLERIVKTSAEKICKTYKTNQNEVEMLIMEKVLKNQQLTAHINTLPDASKIEKNKDYKDILKQVKKQIYYDLRTYQRAASSIANSHTSTFERDPYLNDFITQITPELTNSEVVIDIGGGLFVATLKLEQLRNIQKYIWLDKDKASYEKLVNYKREHKLENLFLFNEKIGDHPWEHYFEKKVDLAIMLKLIPVVNRQEKHLLKQLANIPASKILITGSKEALVKKQNIQKRETAVLQEFIKSTGREIVKHIDIENEFGYILA